MCSLLQFETHCPHFGGLAADVAVARCNAGQLRKRNTFFFSGQQRRRERETSWRETSATRTRCALTNGVFRSSLTASEPAVQESEKQTRAAVVGTKKRPRC